MSVLLAKKWAEADNPTGWWMSEKLDGCRAIWDGSQFLSRNGNIFHAPDWFKAQMPNDTLDGELFLDRGEFQRTMSIVRRHSPDERWKEIKFMVFDAPDQGGTFEDRIKALTEIISGSKYVVLVEHTLCTGKDHLETELNRVISLRGEGLMLRQPGSYYQRSRSSTLLKVKPFYDDEATVIGYVDGKGKHEGVVGALVCELPNGIRFNVGSGLTDANRFDPPVLGEVITFKYMEKTKAGVPRHPSFLRTYYAA